MGLPVELEFRWGFWKLLDASGNPIRVFYYYYYYYHHYFLSQNCIEIDTSFIFAVRIAGNEWNLGTLVG